MNVIKSVSYIAPSNIALVKYWGKHGVQLPSNPSISFTLSECTSRFDVSLLEKNSQKESIRLLFEQVENQKFVSKITSLFDLIKHQYPIVDQYDWYIESSNTFPHSSGIASSASSMAALAMCIEALQNNTVDVQKASNIARLGSGSASRSVIPKVAWWGHHPQMPKSSDEYAIPVWNQVNDIFLTFRDTILIISKEEKSVSSSVGHNLMDTNPYRDVRFQNAKENIIKLYRAMVDGDMDTFGKIVEYEALSLHALMMMSDPSYILIKPNTLAAIEKIKSFREDTGVPVFFTIDAGPNLHVLYPEKYQTQVDDFISTDLKSFCEKGQYIKDYVGDGPEKSHRFSSKILLFGEYMILNGGYAISMPYDTYSLCSTFSSDQQPSELLNDFYLYLTHLGMFQNRISNSMKKDIDNGLYIDSNIPLGYGLGSSGALVACIYSQYISDKKTELNSLKDELARMEDYFHSQSSGIDPLTSYIDKALFFKNNMVSPISDICFEDKFELIDSGISRNAKQAIAHFKKLNSDLDFSEKLSHLTDINNQLVTNYIENEDIGDIMRHFSEKQYELFVDFIPENIKPLWLEGLQDDTYYMKLCGAGFGGCYLKYNHR